ncbi:hypothetical protein NP493_654g01024 [Ridgeia piscesae]|uniref:Uncharacterized protein n=1 Tax=Ridgeia piscesae TaxID=27915 RepID=A0AAD9KTQ4_RIDPI|nr:hypothetical protein NP493_654g01024 [Ridgeia piscesae]
MDFRAVLITLAIFVAVVACADSDDREAEGQSADASAAAAAAAEKRRIFRYGRGGSILRFGKRGAIFRYGRGATDSDVSELLGQQVRRVECVCIFTHLCLSYWPCILV